MTLYLATLAFLVLMSVLIAGYFYIQWAKGRDAAAADTTPTDQPR